MIYMKMNYKKFIDYNIRDVKILVDLDKKLNYIEIGRGAYSWSHSIRRSLYEFSVS